MPTTLLIFFSDTDAKHHHFVATLAAFATLVMFLNVLYYSRGFRRTSIIVKILISVMAGN